MLVGLETEEQAPGFNFENVHRNKRLIQNGLELPKAIKTGTTIAGCVFDGGVVLGADTRATSGSIVADKNCDKIHRLAKHIYCCGAGTAADTEMTTRMIEAQLELQRLNTGGRVVPVATANQLLKQMLFRYQGHISAALIVGGVDNSGSYIYSIYPHGSTDFLPYTTMGSGSLAAMGVFESRFKPNMNEDEAKKLVRDAIAAGIFNDLGSGSNVDLVVIKKDLTEILRGYEYANVKGVRTLDYSFKKGTTAVLSTKIRNYDVTQTVRVIPSATETPMETA